MKDFKSPNVVSSVTNDDMELSFTQGESGVRVAEPSSVLQPIPHPLLAFRFQMVRRGKELVSILPVKSRHAWSGQENASDQHRPFKHLGIYAFRFASATLDAS